METMKPVTNPKEYPLNLMMDFYKIYGYPSDNACHFLTADQITGLNAVLGTLEKRERDILILHYKHGKTWKEIGKKYNVSHQYVAHLKKLIFSKINKPYNYILIKNGYINTIVTCISSNDHYGNHNKLSNKNFILELSIDNLGLSTRCINAIINYNFNSIKTINDLISMNVDDIYKIRNLGIYRIKEINEKLEYLGIRNTAWSTISRKDYNK